MYFFSRGLRINPGATEAELMIVGVSGTLVNFLGLFGNLNYFVVFCYFFCRNGFINFGDKFVLSDFVIYQFFH